MSYSLIQNASTYESLQWNNPKSEKIFSPFSLHTHTDVYPGNYEKEENYKVYIFYYSQPSKQKHIYLI